MAIRKCISCGAILGDGLSTCPYCGAPNPIDVGKKTTQQTTYQTNQSYKASHSSYYSGPTKNQPTKNQPTKQAQPRSGNGAWKRVLICLSVIIIAVVGFFAIRHFTFNVKSKYKNKKRKIKYVLLQFLSDSCSLVRRHYALLGKLGQHTKACW